MKKKVIRDIIIILIATFILSYYNHQIAVRDRKIISPLPMNPNIVFAVAYKQPPLADLPEREKNIAIIKKIWRKDWKIGVEIARCESGLKANAENTRNTNGTSDQGLFQINTVHSLDRGDLLNPVANASFAYILHQEQGVNPWLSSRSCWNK